MKQSNSKENILPEDIAITQGTTSTDFTKPNKVKFLQTISSNFSHQSNRDKILSRNNKFPFNQNNTTNKTFSPLKTVENTQNNIYSKTVKKSRGSIVPISIENHSKKNNRNIKSSLIQNLLLPRNINSYTHLIRGKGVGIYAEIDWALRLRDYTHKNKETKVLDYKDYYYRKNQKLEEIKEPKEEIDTIQLTQNFAPPYFYEEDLKKYKNKKKKFEKSLIYKLNPNFNTIKHLIYRNKGDHSNKSQYHFATTLRNIQTSKENKNKKFEVLPVVDKNKINKFSIAKFLSPCTKQGIYNIQKIDKYLSKKYEYKYGQGRLDGEKIFKKILYEDNKYTISGIGETLGDVKYDNYFRDKNIFNNKKIIETETNPMCKFELGLRTYGNDEDIKNRTHRTFRQKRKNKNIKIDG